MGGDDLGSDDDYLAAPLAGVNDYVDNSSVDDDGQEQEPQSQKRQRTNDNSEREREYNTSNSEAAASIEITKEAKKSKKRGGSMQVLGTKIRLESTESKAEILSEFSGADFSASHIAKLGKNKDDKNVDSDNFMDRLMCLTSKKKLKNKLQQRSPRAIILCLSARRCVAILKDLGPVKLRVAKLFPKQGTIGEQSRSMEITEYSLAVGTPHRIKELLARGSLTLKNTQLLGLDTFLNPKHQSVYTLHDTAPYLQSILKEHAQPICNKGKNELKIGFV